MAESFSEYRARVLGYLGDRDPIRVLRGTSRKLDRLIKGTSRRMLTRHPAPGKWSILEIVAHLADAELAFGWRLRNMLATPGAHLQWWDEHLWSQALAYGRMDVQMPLDVFHALRKSHLALLQSAPRPMWRSCYGVHDKRGRQSVEEFVVMEAAHDLNHLIQIKRLRASQEPTQR